MFVQSRQIMASLRVFFMSIADIFETSVKTNAVDIVAAMIPDERVKIRPYKSRQNNANNARN